jgi:hypothetical protein
MRTSPRERLSGCIHLGVGAILPILTTLTMSILLLSLKKPRCLPSGIILCIVEFATFIYGLCWNLALWAVRSRNFHIQGAFIAHSQHVCFAVIGAWIALRLAGAWKPGSHWIDRAGRATGLAWVLATTLLWSRYFLV